MTMRQIALKVSEIVKRLREGVDPDDIQETEAVMDAAANYIEALQGAAILFARDVAHGERVQEHPEGSQGANAIPVRDGSKLR